VTTLDVSYTASLTRPRQMRAVRVAPKSASYVASKTIRNRSLDHALRQMNDIHGASKASIDQMRVYLRRVLTDEMAYASLSNDGNGGTLAQWRAGRSYIAFEVNTYDGDSLVYADATGQIIISSVGADASDPGRLHVALQQFTEDLTARKPEWRAVREAHGNR